MNRTTARENAFLLLFESSCKSDEVAEEIYSKAIEYRDIKCDDYVREVFFGVNENSRIISEEINNNLVGWNRARLSKVSEAILKLSVYEMMFLDDVPAMAGKHREFPSFLFVFSELRSMKCFTWRIFLRLFQ